MTCFINLLNLCYVHNSLDNVRKDEVMIFYPRGTQHADCLSCEVYLRTWAGKKTWILDFYHLSSTRFSPSEVFLILVNNTVTQTKILEVILFPQIHIVFHDSKIMLISSTFHCLSISSSLTQANSIFQQVRHAAEYLLHFHNCVIRPSLLLFLCPLPRCTVLSIQHPMICPQSVNLSITL